MLRVKYDLIDPVRARILVFIIQPDLHLFRKVCATQGHVVAALFCSIYIQRSMYYYVCPSSFSYKPLTCTSAWRTYPSRTSTQLTSDWLGGQVYHRTPQNWSRAKSARWKNVYTHSDRIWIHVQSCIVPLSSKETTGAVTSITPVDLPQKPLLPGFHPSITGLAEIMSFLKSTFLCILRSITLIMRCV